MKKFKPQFTRLLFIDRKIREMAYPNCNSLAREWEGISSRTIARDIEYMRDMLGAPVEFDRLKNGYFYSEGNYSLPAMTINESDLFAIALAKKALEAYRETPLYGKLVGIFEKIGAMLPDKVTIDPSWIDSRVTFLEPPRTKIIPEVWENIAKALREQRVLKIAHKTPSFNEPVNRDAEPYHLVNYHGEWYLVARCRLKKKVLLFAISRISGAEILNERFTMSPDFSMEKFAGAMHGIVWDDKEFEVRIRFTPDQAPYIREREWHHTQRIEDEEDGGLVLSFKTNNLYETKRWVLSWGADAEVMEPEELKGAVRREVGAMGKIY